MESGIKVQDIMKKKVFSLDINTPIYEVAKLMKEKDIGSVIIIDGNEAKGIITERDLVRKIVAYKVSFSTPAKDIMSSPLIVIHPDIDLIGAVKIMNKNNIRRLVVINDEEELVGIITENDVLGLLPSLIDLLEEKLAERL